MNCKPLEMAICISGDLPEDLPTIGRIVKVIKIDPEWHEPVWEYEGERLIDNYGLEITAVADKFLLPIRPGETTEESIETMRLITNIPQKKTA